MLLANCLKTFLTILCIAVVVMCIWQKLPETTTITTAENNSVVKRFSDDNKKFTQTTTFTTAANTTVAAETSANDSLLVNEVGGVWHQVSNRKMIAFSAYYDDRINPLTPEVKVIAEIHCQSNKTFFCRLTFQHNLSATVEGHVRMINSGCDVIYEAHFILCPIPKDLASFYPTSLQLFGNANELVKVVPQMVINYPSAKIEHKLAICVGRMFNFRDWLQLAFFIEFYKLMGATKFVFYTRSYTNDVEKILKYYEGVGLIDLVPFPMAPNLDSAKSEELERGTHVTFQLLQMNDCSYQLRGKAKYAANIDADEFILPSSNETLLELLERNDVKSDWDGFLFRSRYYRQNWPQITSLTQGNSVLNSFFHLSKIVYPHSIPCPFTYRTKSVNKPNSVVRVANHNLHESLKGDPLMKEINLDQAVIVHLRKMKTDEIPIKASNLPTSDTCAHAADNIPAENPFVKYIDRLMSGMLSIVKTVG